MTALVPNSLPAADAFDAALAAFHAKVTDLRAAGTLDTTNPLHALLALVVVANVSATLDTSLRRAAELVLLVAAALTERPDAAPTADLEPNDDEADDVFAPLRLTLGVTP